MKKTRPKDNQIIYWDIVKNFFIHFLKLLVSGNITTNTINIRNIIVIQDDSNNISQSDKLNTYQSKMLNTYRTKNRTKPNQIINHSILEIRFNIFFRLLDVCVISSILSKIF